MHEDRAAWKARVQSLVEEYRRTRSRAVRDTIVLELLWIIEERARHIGPAYRIKWQHLVGYGVEGVLHALEKYQNGHKSNAHFMTFVTSYITGWIFNGVACENERYRQAERAYKLAAYYYECALRRGEAPGEKPTIIRQLDLMPRTVAFSSDAHSWARADDVKELARLERTLLDEAFGELEELEQLVLERIYFDGWTVLGVVRGYALKTIQVKRLYTMALKKLHVAFLRREGIIIR